MSLVARLRGYVAERIASSFLSYGPNLPRNENFPRIVTCFPMSVLNSSNEAVVYSRCTSWMLRHGRVTCAGKLRSGQVCTVRNGEIFSCTRRTSTSNLPLSRRRVGISGAATQHSLTYSGCSSALMRNQVYNAPRCGKVAAAMMLNRHTSLPKPMLSFRGARALD